MLAYKISRIYEFDGGCSDIYEYGYFLCREDAVKELVKQIVLYEEMDFQSEIDVIARTINEKEEYEPEGLFKDYYYELEEILIYE